MAINELLAAAFCKGKLSSGSKPQPQRASDRESNESRFHPRPPALHRANRGWAAPAPWALLLCWGSRVPETHSPRVLLRGEAGLVAPRPSAPRPQPCPRASSATQHRGPVTPTAQNELLGAAFCKVNLCWGSKPQPQRASDRESNASLFCLRHPAHHRANRGWSAPAPWALMLCWGSRVPETHSPRDLLRGEAGLDA